MSLKKYLNPSDRITVFSKYNCSECSKIKSFLEDSSQEFKYINIENVSDDDDETFEIIDNLKTLSNSSSFPFCFFYGDYISASNLKKKLIFETTEDF
jgi:glutaredoxin